MKHADEMARRAWVAKAAISMTAGEELFQRPIPFPIMEAPPLITTSLGEWRLAPIPGVPVVRGYFMGLQAGPLLVWTLTRAGKMWMSTAPMELESQSHHLYAARGNVIVGGLGLGALVYNLLLKPAVQSVTVIERDPEVLLLMKGVMRSKWLRGPIRDKLVLIEGDALKFKTSDRFDIALIDIWEKAGDAALRPDMQQISKNVGAGAYAGWGQEWDFMSWLIESGYPRPGLGRALPAELWIEYSEVIGVPLVGRAWRWMSTLAYEAVANQVLS